MDWTDDWEFRDGMYWYKQQALWMYAGSLYNTDEYNQFGQHRQPKPDDWLDRLYDIAKGGDVIARIRAITVLGKMDREGDEFNRILDAWAFAQDYTDTLDVCTRVIYNPVHFNLIKQNAQNIWYNKQSGSIRRPHQDILDMLEADRRQTPTREKTKTKKKTTKAKKSAKKKPKSNYKGNHKSKPKKMPILPPRNDKLSLDVEQSIEQPIKHRPKPTFPKMRLPKLTTTPVLPTKKPKRPRLPKK